MFTPMGVTAPHAGHTLPKTNIKNKPATTPIQYTTGFFSFLAGAAAAGFAAISALIFLSLP